VPRVEASYRPNGRVVKPKVNFSFTVEQKRALCKWIKELKMPGGYAYHIANCIDMSNATISRMKSHYCHAFMESLLLNAFSALLEYVWKPLTKWSQSF